MRVRADLPLAFRQRGRPVSKVKRYLLTTTRAAGAEAFADDDVELCRIQMTVWVKGARLCSVWQGKVKGEAQVAARFGVNLEDLQNFLNVELDAAERGL